MSINELENKLTESGWTWSCWENLWRKDQRSIEIVEEQNLAILYENDSKQCETTIDELYEAKYI